MATWRIWPSRVAGDIETKAAAAGVSLVRVEDGFLRSRGLGATCHLPLSLIFAERVSTLTPTDRAISKRCSHSPISRQA